MATCRLIIEDEVNIKLEGLAVDVRRKLANSLKSKDRLTQKDIEMAKNLVKVFPLLRGEKNVIASLTATAETRSIAFFNSLLFVLIFLLLF